MTTTLLVRKTVKQSWAQASKIEMLDSPERLHPHVDGMNNLEGWAKYRAGEVVTVNVDELEAVSVYEERAGV